MLALDCSDNNNNEDLVSALEGSDNNEDLVSDAVLVDLDHGPNTQHRDSLAQLLDDHGPAGLVAHVDADVVVLEDLTDLSLYGELVEPVQLGDEHLFSWQTTEITNRVGMVFQKSSSYHILKCRNEF